MDFNNGFSIYKMYSLTPNIFSNSFILRAGLLLILTFSVFSQAFAARYDLVDVEAEAPDHVLAGINNIGTIVGMNAAVPPLPFYWRVYVDPKTEEISYRTEDIKLLPTDTLGITGNLGFGEIHITAINTEQAFGLGGDIIGWYTDKDGNVKSVLWYQKLNLQGEYEYNASSLPSLTETVRNCLVEKSENFYIII